MKQTHPKKLGEIKKKTHFTYSYQVDSLIRLLNLQLVSAAFSLYI